MTKAAQHFGKDLSHFMRSPDTQEYIAALNSAKSAEYLEANRGRYGGTWAHPKLAVFFARWLDVRFSVWCDAVIEDILKGAAQGSIMKPERSPPRWRSRRNTQAGRASFNVSDTRSNSPFRTSKYRTNAPSACLPYPD